jgi:hypothetical protein
MMAVQPEHIGDVDQGTPPPASEVDELGLTPDERAAFDAMKDGPMDGDGPAEPPPPAEAGTPAPGETPPAPAPGDPKTPPAEPPAEPDDEDDIIVNNPKTGKPQKTMSVGKHNRLLTKAQQEAQALRQQMETERLERVKLAERLSILNEALTTPPPQPQLTPEQQQQQAMAQNPMLEPDIDPDEDAIGAVKQANRRLAFMAQQLTQSHESTQEQLEDQQLLQSFQRDTVAYSQTPDGQHFMGPEGAYQFLKNSRLTELGISLFDKDPTDPNEVFTQAEINRMIADFNAEEKWVVQNAIKSKKSPSAAIMKLARGRGWKPPAPGAAATAPAAPAAAAPAAPAPRAPTNGNGAPPPLAQPPAAAPARSAVDQITEEAAAAAAGRSLSDGGGAPPPTELTAEKLLRMSDDEFARYVDNLPKEKLDAIMGREQQRSSFQ